MRRGPLSGMRNVGLKTKGGDSITYHTFPVHYRLMSDSSKILLLKASISICGLLVLSEINIFRFDCLLFFKGEVLFFFYFFKG